MNAPTLIAVAAALFSTAGCVIVSEPIETKAYDLSGFDGISASAGVNVALKQGPFSVKAEGPKSRLERLIVERRGDELVIRREPTIRWGTWTQSDLVTVAAPNYASINASGGADVSGDGLQLADIAITVSGGADINLSGACRKLTLEASGGADFRGKDLACESAAVSASGGADAYVTATDASGRGSGGADIAFYGVTGAAFGDASSGSDVRFHGNPASFEKEESGGGDVSLSGS